MDTYSTRLTAHISPTISPSKLGPAIVSAIYKYQDNIIELPFQFEIQVLELQLYQIKPFLTNT